MKTIAGALLAAFMWTALAFASDLGGYVFLKISGSDARAVVTTPQGERRLVAPGDVLGDATIKEIAADRVVLETVGENGTGVMIVKVKDGRQQTSRLQKMPVREKTLPGHQDKDHQKFGD
jgi:hypothetical protein